ncbi:MAG: DNA mismatch repair protein MutS [Endomicrobium sp.]|jgi:DNA mismatch repair protein MutS|uniref:DNA mismatch repair protein MutS n=1 Tax=Candidatus Endomicrobiellum cubanum TaxID=3242325 RepID=UPI0028365384|nr:DNA mismatch repair protein MutS [Endomicrobium sp.]
MQQYWDIKSKYPGMILFFRLGDFYEMFGEDAIQAAPVLDVVLTKRTGTPMCGVPHHSVNFYIRKLISSGLKVVICDQLEEAGVSKGIVKRGVTKVITPGTVLEDVLLDSKTNNFLMALYFENVNDSLFVAFADISTGEFFTLETTLKAISTEISRHPISELLVSSSNVKNEFTENLISNIKVPISNIDDSFFKYESAKKTIEDLFAFNAIKKFSLNKKGAICVCGALLSYIREIQPQSVGIFSNIRYIKNSDFMYLDTVAIKNLEILSCMHTGKLENSLLWVVASTKTAMGARTLRNWIIQPLLDIEKIKNRQNIVKFFIDNSNVRKSVIENLKRVSDIERIAARISSLTAGPKDLIALKDSLKAINKVCEIINSVPGLSLHLEIPKNDQIIDKIFNVIVDEPPISLKDGGVIKKGVDDKLDELRKLSTDVKMYISDVESKEKQSTGINSLKVGYTSVFGYYIEISKANIHLAPKHYVRKQTLANAERYITEELKVLEEKILYSQEKILILENKIFNNLRLEIALYLRDILKTSQIISEIDIFSGFAKDALEYNYVCPAIVDSQELYIKDGRHPVVERILKNGEFISNDIAFDENSKVIIITGPNMAGKSTYLRQTALIIIMAQIGCFVPASQAKIGVVDRIFTRIGAGDNLAGGESTFMVEMSETATILNQYTQKSLIILDEVGRGTSTYDGMSIAWSIIEFFADAKIKANNGIKVLFATHYFELTDLANTLSGVVNYNVGVKEWNGDVIFLHKIVKGSADKSYGIHVAKIAGIPNKVISRAYKVLNKLESSHITSKFDVNNQLDLFSVNENNLIQEDSDILQELRNIDINALTPLEAFKILLDWKRKI